jgi:hypothetical protein
MGALIYFLVRSRIHRIEKFPEFFLTPPRSPSLKKRGRNVKKGAPPLAVGLDSTNNVELKAGTPIS